MGINDICIPAMRCRSARDSIEGVIGCLIIAIWQRNEMTMIMIPMMMMMGCGSGRRKRSERFGNVILATRLLHPSMRWCSNILWTLLAVVRRVLLKTMAKKICGVFAQFDSIYYRVWFSRFKHRLRLLLERFFCSRTMGVVVVRYKMCRHCFDFSVLLFNIKNKYIVYKRLYIVLKRVP